MLDEAGQALHSSSVRGCSAPGRVERTRGPPVGCPAGGPSRRARRTPSRQRRWAAAQPGPRSREPRAVLQPVLLPRFLDRRRLDLAAPRELGQGRDDDRLRRRRRSGGGPPRGCRRGRSRPRRARSSPARPTARSGPGPGACSRRPRGPGPRRPAAPGGRTAPAPRRAAAPRRPPARRGAARVQDVADHTSAATPHSSASSFCASSDPVDRRAGGQQLDARGVRRR